MTFHFYYKLEGKKVVACDIEECLANLEKTRRVALSTLRGTKPIIVSTVFLGFNHSFGDNVPLLFETMVFGGDFDGWQERCSTWQDAMEQHKRIRKMVKEKLEKIKSG